VWRAILLLLSSPILYQMECRQGPGFEISCFFFSFSEDLHLFISFLKQSLVTSETIQAGEVKARSR
jgi:hypothetical protein